MYCKVHRPVNTPGVSDNKGKCVQLVEYLSKELNPWGRLQRSVSCVNVVPSEYGTSVPKGMTCLSWGTGGFSFIPLKSHQATSSPSRMQKSSLKLQPPSIIAGNDASTSTFLSIFIFV